MTDATPEPEPAPEPLNIAPVSFDLVEKSNQQAVETRIVEDGETR